MEKVENVLKRVYDPRRLSLAWKQVLAVGKIGPAIDKKDGPV